MVASHDWDVWSTHARVVVTRPAALSDCVRATRELLEDIDLAASRFRTDSEIRNLPAPEAHLSPLLADLMSVALTAAAQTDGAVDPTIGGTLCDLGYDRDLAYLDLEGSRAVLRVRRVPGWRSLTLDGQRLLWPPGVELDLGATAKARAADLCARHLADQFDTGVLVGLGGDIATAGPAPDGGWQVLVHDSDADPDAHISLPAGSAIATSSTTRRTWRRGLTSVHHLIDPATALPAEPVWHTVTVAASSCVAANTASTATIVKGRSGLAWLTAQGLPARLVDRGGAEFLLGGWPRETITHEAS
jgi:thiamine biosynthesis lipoprotein